MLFPSFYLLSYVEHFLIDENKRAELSTHISEHIKEKIEDISADRFECPECGWAHFSDPEDT